MSRVPMRGLRTYSNISNAAKLEDNDKKLERKSIVKSSEISCQQS